MTCPCAGQCHHSPSPCSFSCVSGMLEHRVVVQPAAFPEPERLPGGMKRDHEGRLMPGWGDPEPATQSPQPERPGGAHASHAIPGPHRLDAAERHVACGCCPCFRTQTASPDPERCAECGQSRDGLKHRCWTTHFRRVRESGDGLHVLPDCHPFQPAPTPPSADALREHPGEHHTFSMTCDRCGKRGYVNLSVIGPDERLSIEPIGDHP